MQTVEQPHLPAMVGQVSQKAEATPAAPLNLPRGINSLTGLRFLPLFAIVFHHSRDYFACWRGFAEGISFVHAVSFFFILSGFILTYRYGWVQGTGNTLYFYAARIARLWPAHAICLALLIFSMPEVFKVTGDLVPIFWCNLFMVHSWIPVWKYYFSFNAPSWSSATLSFFDICFPFLILASRRSMSLVLLGTASLALLMVTLCNVLHLPASAPYHPSLPAMVYINPLARIFEFAVGIVTALLFVRYKARYTLGLAAATAVEFLLLGGLIYINLSSNSWQESLSQLLTPAGAMWFHRAGVVLLPFALLIAVLATERGLVSRFFATKTMAMLGDMSFALYMLHGVFIAYFAVNFIGEPTLHGSFLFFAALLVGAHLLQTQVAKPLQKQLLGLSTWMLSKRWAPPPRPGSKTIRVPVTMKQRILVVLEVAIFAALFYGALPTIHKVSESEAQAFAPFATVRNTDFGSLIRCRAATAALKKDKVVVKTVWQALQSQSVNLYVNIRVLDSTGRQITELGYCQDGRHQSVSEGTLWTNAVDVPINPGQRAAQIAITVARGKRKFLLVDNHSSSPQLTMNVPVIAPASFN